MNDPTPAAAPDFDRELSLADLARGMPLDRLVSALEVLVGGPVGVEAPDGRIVAGHAVPGGQGLPFRLELEPLGLLRVPAELGPHGGAAVSLLQMMLHARAQVLRAGDLHANAMSADYELLRERHEALQRSEAQYRELAQTLERRVQEQIALLDERQRQLYLAERLAAIGQLAAGIAHEINNPIGFIRSNLDSGRRYLASFHALQQRLAAGAPLAQVWEELDLDYLLKDLDELLAESMLGVDRVARIVQDLRGFSGIDRPEPEDLDVNEQLAKTVATLREKLPPGVQVRQSLQPGLPRLLCLPGHLNQVFVNLFTNALQAVEGLETPILELRTRLDGEHLVVEVSDNGCGIAPEILSRVFDPFFTTRGVGKGTGLGLTVARDIVGAHDGQLKIESQTGAGTTVQVRLPLSR